MALDMRGKLHWLDRRTVWVVLAGMLLGCTLMAGWLMDCVRIKRIKAIDGAEMRVGELSLLRDGLGSDCLCSWVWRWTEGNLASLKLLHAGEAGIGVLAEALSAEDVTTTANSLYGVKQWLMHLYGRKTYDGIAFPGIALREVKSALILLLDHPEPTIRVEAVTCLSYFEHEDESVFAMIEECLQDDDKEVAHRARLVLGSMTGDGASEIELQYDLRSDLEKMSSYPEVPRSEE